MDAEVLTSGNELMPVSIGGGDLSTTRPIILPAILAAAGDDAVTRFAEYFTVHIQNPHTRRAYLRNAVTFLRWCEDRGLGCWRSKASGTRRCC